MNQEKPGRGVGVQHTYMSVCEARLPNLSEGRPRQAGKKVRAEPDAGEGA